MRSPAAYAEGMNALRAALSALVLVVPGVSPAGTAIACGPPSPLGPSGFPRVGPLLFGFYNFPANTTGRAHSAFTPGYPTKVVLQLTPHRPLRTRLLLTGRSCSTGKSLRFWYDREQPPFSRLPATTEQLARTGSLVQILRADRSAGFHGYMLFTHRGRWKIGVATPRRSLGSIVVAVG
jgi:hypothetical protein